MKRFAWVLLLGLALAACEAGTDAEVGACYQECDELYAAEVDRAERVTTDIPNFLEDFIADSDEARDVCRDACLDGEDPKKAFVCHCYYLLSWCMTEWQGYYWEECPRQPEF